MLLPPARWWIPTCLLLAIASEAAASGQWMEYDNRLWGYRLDIPTHRLPVQEQFPRGDGRRFHSHDGRAELLVHARWQDEDIGPCIPDRAVAPAVAGVQRSPQRGKDARGHWQRHWLASPALSVELSLRYPADQAWAYAPDIVRIIDSLQVY